VTHMISDDISPAEINSFGIDSLKLLLERLESKKDHIVKMSQWYETAQIRGDDGTITILGNRHVEIILNQQVVK